MDFDLSDEQQMLRDSAWRYMREQYGFETRRAIERSEAGWSPAHWAAYAEFGWLALGLPEDAGGLGGSMVDTAILLEAMGKGLVLEPYVSTAILCARILERCGNAVVRTEALSSIGTGELRLALAHDEPGRQHQRTHAATSARRTATGFELWGAKTMVFDAPCAQRFIVSAGIEGEAGLALFMVDRDCAGVRLQSYRLIDGSRAADIEFDAAALPAASLLLQGEPALDALDEALDRATLAQVAQALGAMETVLVLSADHLKTRVQFGQPLARFQALQHRMAEMFVEVQATRSILFQGLSGIDSAEKTQRGAAVSAAKVAASRAGRFVGGQGIQLHGGMGMTEECAVGHYFKRLVAFEKAYGDTEWHLRRFAVSAASGDD